MNFENVAYEIETHPLVTAIAVFGVLFLGYNVIKGKGATVATPSVASSDATKTQEVYNQTYNSYPTVQPPTVTPPTTTPPPPPVVLPPPVPKPKPVSNPTTSHKYVTVQAWPAQKSTLWGIAVSSGVSLSKLKSLNPHYSSNWNLIHPGDQVRIA